MCVCVWGGMGGGAGGTNWLLNVLIQICLRGVGGGGTMYLRHVSVLLLLPCVTLAALSCVTVVGPACDVDVLASLRA